MKPYKVLTINPGSTSTKIALFEGEECLYSQTVSHEAKELEQYASMSEQQGHGFKPFKGSWHRT